MKLQKFSARGIHGYLTIDVDFDKELTFLTGINGSGKSSVIHAVAALITPSLRLLAGIDFKSLTLSLEHDEKRLTISCAKSDNVIRLWIGASDGALEYPVFKDDGADPPYRVAEREEEYYQTISMSLREHSVLTTLSSLPTPMFLDLDRRAVTLDPDTYRYVARRRRERNIFSFALSQSLGQTASLIDRENRSLQVRIRQINDKYRRQLIGSFLNVSVSKFGPLVAPKQSDVNAITQLKRQLPHFPHLLEVGPSDVEKGLTPFLNMMEDTAKKLSGKKVESLMSRPGGAHNPEFDDLVRWSTNLSQLQKIIEQVKIVEQHNNERERADAKMRRFIDSVNKFLRDSKKELVFDEIASIGFRVIGSEKVRPITSLSSGEAQIFVLLAHLYYNPLAQTGNVFIIDEPELSLHVAWQEMFVESVIEANPGVQFIMATHSPSIILDRLESCRDMGVAGRIELDA